MSIRSTFAATVGLTLSLTATLRAQDDTPLVQARKGFQSELVRSFENDYEMPDPADYGYDEDGFSLVDYPSPAGDLKGLLKRPEGGDRKRPAVVWVLGGFPAGGATASLFEARDAAYDDSAKAFDEFGFVTFYPSFRGSFSNPGVRESFLGEVDDLIAAVDYVKGLDGVDPEAVFLMGHDAGATLVLLTAETGIDVAGIVCLGPDADLEGRDPTDLAFDLTDPEEHRLRSPVHFLEGVRSPTLIVEGSNGFSIDFEQLVDAPRSSEIRLLQIDDADHSDHLATTNDWLAPHIQVAFAEDALADRPFPKSGLQQLFDEARLRRDHAEDLRALADQLEGGTDLSGERSIQSFLLSFDEEAIQQASSAAEREGFTPGELIEGVDDEGDPYFLLVVSQSVRPTDLEAFFKVTDGIRSIARRFAVQMNGWVLL